MSRKEFYEICVFSLTKEDFRGYFDCEPADTQAFDYDFQKVHWNMNLEYAYNEFMLEDESD